MALNVSNYLDVENLLINELIGDVMLFTIVGIVIIAVLSRKYNISFPVTLVLSTLWVLTTIGYAANPAYLAFIVLIDAVLFYAAIKFNLR